MARSLYSELGPPLGRPLVSPRLERLLIDPEGERAPADQGVVVLLPVADAVGGLRGGLASGHRGCGGVGSGEGAGRADRSSIPKSTGPPKPFVQQRPPEHQAVRPADPGEASKSLLWRGNVWPGRPQLGATERRLGHDRADYDVGGGPRWVTTQPTRSDQTRKLLSCSSVRPSVFHPVLWEGQKVTSRRRIPRISLSSRGPVRYDGRGTVRIGPRDDSAPGGQG